MFESVSICVFGRKLFRLVFPRFLIEDFNLILVRRSVSVSFFASDARGLVPLAAKGRADFDDLYPSFQPPLSRYLPFFLKLFNRFFQENVFTSLCAEFSQSDLSVDMTNASVWGSPVNANNFISVYPSSSQPNAGARFCNDVCRGERKRGHENISEQPNINKSLPNDNAKTTSPNAALSSRAESSGASLVAFISYTLSQRKNGTAEKLKKFTKLQIVTR